MIYYEIAAVHIVYNNISIVLEIGIAKILDRIDRIYRI